MKFKSIIISCLFLAILTIGAVSAADENLTAADLTVPEDSFDEEIGESISDDVLSGDDIDMEVRCPTVIHDLDVDDVYIYSNVNGKNNFSIFVDGREEYTGTLENNFYDFNSSLTYGKHVLNVTFSGDEEYDSCSVSTTFYYSYLDVNYAANDYQKNTGDLSVSLISDDDLSMEAKVFVDDSLVFDGNISKGYNLVPLSNLTIGRHAYKIVTSGKGKKYTPLTVEDTFTYEIRPIVRCPELIIVGSDENLTFELPSNADGNIQLLFNGEEMNATLLNGKSSFSLKNLEIGEYSWVMIYENDTEYKDGYDLGDLIVIPSPDFNFTTSATVKKGVGTKITVTANPGLKGRISIRVPNQDGEEQEYGAAFKDGKAVVPVTFYEFGSHKVNYTFEYEDSIGLIYGASLCPEFKGSFNVKVYLKNPVITAKTFKADYTSKTKYQARVKGIDNKYSAGRKVTFELYNYDKYNNKIGKKVATKTAKTDNKGYAKIVNFNVAPGEYRVKIKYGDAVLTKKYTVKSIVKINQMFKKKKHSVDVLLTSKTIKIGATLKKVDGKVQKGKKVKIIFYRDNVKTGKLIKIKTYTAKTNSKGVASLTLKKSPVKATSREMRDGYVFTVRIVYSKEVAWGAFQIRSKAPFKYYFV